MEVVTAGEAGLAAASNHLSSADRVARLDADRAQVTAQRLQATTVIDDDSVAVDSEKARQDNHTVIRGDDRSVRGRSEVKTDVVLMIDHLAAVEISAMIRKRCFDLGIPELDKGLLPSRLRARVAG